MTIKQGAVARKNLFGVGNGEGRHIASDNIGRNFFVPIQRDFGVSKGIEAKLISPVKIDLFHFLVR
jgi:hypothetical protein